MNEIQFLKPKLVGARFQGHAIPLEVLKDLAVLEEMVIEVAKWQFIKDHPGRERAPRSDQTTAGPGQRIGDQQRARARA